MQKRVVTIVVVVALLIGLGLTAHLLNGPGGPGFAQVLRKMVHGY
ncbi:MAG TPA: hypothetical protein VGK74_13720 [Symbiobacteriaceae bacterium]